MYFSDRNYKTDFSFLTTSMLHLVSNHIENKYF